MPRFMVTRHLPELTPDQLEDVGKKVVSIAAEMDGVKWIRSHLTADGRQSFCEFEAPSEESVREHSRRSGLPVDNVMHLGQEIGPSLFK